MLLLKCKNRNKNKIIKLVHTIEPSGWMISNGDKNYNRNEWGPIRSVIKRVIYGIGRTINGSPIFWSRGWLQTIGRHGIKNQKKKLQNKLAIGSTERTINSAKSATAMRAYNALSAPLLCSLTSMTRTLSYQCSNRAGDNQLRSRRLLWFWLMAWVKGHFFFVYS